MRINFCTIMDERHASFRYRVLLPARQLMGAGHDVSIGDPDYRADIMLFSKHYNRHDPDIARAFPGTKVMDVCDWHMDGGYEKSVKWTEHYNTMIDLSDKVVVSTPVLKHLLNGRGDNANVIQDSYEFEEKPPKFKYPESGVLQLLWFGGPSNLPGLLSHAEDIEGHKVWIITNKKAAPAGLECSNWNPVRMRQGFESCDAVVIPQLLTCNHYLCKGANRLMESVRQGRFVLAHPVPSYQEFDKWMWIGDIKEGIQWLKENESEVEDRIRGCQDYIREKYSPEETGRKWEEVLCRSN